MKMSALNNPVIKRIPEEVKPFPLFPIPDFALAKKCVKTRVIPSKFGGIKCTPTPSGEFYRVKSRKEIKTKIYYENSKYKWFASLIKKHNENVKYNNKCILLSYKTFDCDAHPKLASIIPQPTQEEVEENLKGWEKLSQINYVNKPSKEDKKYNIFNKLLDPSCTKQDLYKLELGNRYKPILNKIVKNKKIFKKINFKLESNARSRVLYYLDNRAVFGPLTKSQHYLRLDRARTIGRAKNLKNLASLLYKENINYFQWLNIENFVNNCKITKKYNFCCDNYGCKKCRYSSPKQVKSRWSRFDPNSCRAQRCYIRQKNIVIVRNPELLKKLKQRINELKQQRQRKVVDFKFRTFQQKCANKYSLFNKQTIEQLFELIKVLPIDVACSELGIKTTVDPQGDDPSSSEEGAAAYPLELDNLMKEVTLLESIDNPTPDILEELKIKKQNIIEWRVKLRSEPQGKLKNLKKTIKDTMRIPGKLMETVENVDNVATRVNTTMDNVLSSVNESLKDEPEEIKIFTAERIIQIIVQIGHILIHPKIETIGLAMAGIITTILGGSYQCIAKLGSYIKKMFTSVSTQPNSDVDGDETTYTKFMKTLYGLVIKASGMVPNKSPNWLTFRNLRAIFIDITIAKRGIESFMKFFEWIIYCIKAMLQYIKRFFAKDPTYEGKLLTDYEDIQTWYYRSMAYLDPQLLNENEVTERFTSKVFALYNEGICHQAQFLKSAGKGPVVGIIKSVIDKLLILKTTLVNRGLNPFVRMAPFVIQIGGKPGLGKSICAMDTSVEILKSMNLGISSSPLWSYQSHLVHWDTLKQQPFILMDDIFQMQTEQLFMQDVTAFIHLAGTSPYTPPMAAIELKQYQIRPLGLILTSNSLYPPTHSRLLDEKALWRRRHMLVEFILKPQYAKWFVGGQIKTKLPDGSEMSDRERKDRAWLEVRIYNSSVDETMGFVPVSYNAFVAMYKQKFALHYKEQTDYVTNYVKQFEDSVSAAAGIDEKVEALVELMMQKKQKKVEQENKSKLAEVVSITQATAQMDETSEAFDTVPSTSSEHVEVGLPPKVTSRVAQLVRKNIMDNALDECIKLGVGKKIKTKENDVIREEFVVDLAKLEEVCKQGIPIWVWHKVTRPIYDIFKIENLLPSKSMYYKLKTLLQLRPKGDRVTEKYTRHTADCVDLPCTLCLFRLTVEKELQTGDATVDPARRAEIESSFANANNLNRLSPTQQELSPCLDLEPELTQYFTENIPDFDIEQCHYLHFAPSSTFLDQMALIHTIHTKLLRNIPISSLEMASYNKILSNAFNREDTCKFANEPLCKCHVVMEAHGKKYMIPRCDRCRAAMKKPVSFDDCSDCAYSIDVQIKGSCFDKKKKKMIMFKNAQIFFDKSVFVMEYSRCKAFCAKFLTKSYKLLKKFCKILIEFVIPILLVGATCLLTYGIYKALKEEVAPQPEPNSFYDGANKTHGVKREAPKPIKPAGQGMLEQPIRIPGRNYIDDVITKIKNNAYDLKITYSGNELSAHGVFLRNKQFLIIKHCWLEIEHRYKTYGGELTMIHSPMLDLQIKYDDITVSNFRNSNLVLLTFSNTCPVKEHPNIVKHIANKNQHERYTHRGSLVICEKTTRIREFTTMRYIDNPITVSSTPNCSEVMIAGAYRYPFGGKGLCGSLLLCNDINPCIIGIHVAGFGETDGFSEPLLRDSFEDIVYKQNIIKDVLLPDCRELELMKHKLDSNFILHGVVAEDQMQHHEVGKSKIIPSLVHGIFPIASEPAPLTPHDPRLPPGTSPMLVGVRKHGQPIRGFPKHIISRISEALSAEMKTYILPVIPIKEISYQEVICGRPGVFGGLNLSTSAGHPFSSFLPSNASNKRVLFNIEETPQGNNLLGMDDMLRYSLAIIHRQIEKGIRPVIIFEDCEKDGRIPVEKCSIPGKTRIFSISPVHYSVYLNKILTPYKVAHKNSRFNTFPTEGLNVNGPEYTQFINMLRSHSEYMVAGDYKSFGATFSTEIFNVVRNCLVDWHKYHGVSEKQCESIYILLDVLINAYHLCFDVIYSASSGMPSGSPITVELNDLVNFCYIFGVYTIIMSPYGLGSYYYFKKYIVLKTYGDDVVIAISKRIVHIFNNQSIQETFAKYDIVYTSGDKSEGPIKPYESIYDVTFLQRKAKHHPYRPYEYMAALDIRRALDIANWCWVSKDHVKATLENMQQCSDALYGHGPEIHAKYRKILVDKACELGDPGNFRTWEELDELYYQEKLPLYPTSQGDDPVAVVEEKMDTVHIGEPIGDVISAPIFESRTWTNMTSTEENVTLREYEERKFLLDTCEWTVNDSIGKNLLTNVSILPRDIVKNNRDSLLAVPFFVNKFVRPENMKITIECNVNEFAVGALMATFYYGACHDEIYQKKKTSIYCSSQMINVVLKATMNNSVELNIPYAYMYPYLRIDTNPEEKSGMELGELRLIVLNQLTCTSTVNITAHLTVHVELEGCIFTGRVDKSLITIPEMFAGLAVAAAEHYLNNTQGQNRDMPPLPGMPTPVQIMPPGNLSYGTNVVPTLCLFRLDPKGQTPHPGLSKRALTIRDFITTEGLISQIEWLQTNKVGDSLKADGWVASPVWTMSDNPTLTMADQSVYYILPPVSYIANLFKQWRGKLKYRFEFIGNSKYSGKLAISYIPGHHKATTYKQARNSTFVEWDIRTADSLILETPYITDRPWWGRSYAAHSETYNYPAPGIIQIFVINPLNLMDSIPKKCFINVYISASSDFELSVPIQPAISSINYREYPIIPPTKTISPLVDQKLCFIGVNDYFQGGKKCVITFKNYILKDVPATFPNLDLTNYYKYTGKPIPYNTNKTALYFFGFQYNWEFYLVPALDESKAQAAAKEYKNNNGKLINNYMIDWVAQGDYITDGGAFEVFKVDTAVAGTSDDDIDWVDVRRVTRAHPQIQPIVTHDNLAHTSFGRLTFGEDFFSLKDLLRRYQYITRYTKTLDGSQEYFVCLPVVPNGPLPDYFTNNNTLLVAREGYLALIADCYRFYRGSMRFKIVCNSGITSPVIVKIQHKPDIVTYTSKVSDSDKRIEQGYATHVFNASLNPILEFEIPFYKDCVYGYLGRPKDYGVYNDYIRTCHLGRLCISILSTKGTDFRFEIYSAIGDDMQFELFQGTPPVKFVQKPK